MSTENLTVAKPSADVLPNGQLNQSPEKANEQFLWITNEGLLRDEGVLYGIAGADREDKLEAIRQYYNIRKAGHSHLTETFGEEIRQLKNSREMLSAELKKMETAPNDPSAGHEKETNLMPLIVQVIAYVTVCFLSYFLIEYWLQPAISSTLICLGLYCFGLFSVFFGRSIMYNSASAVTVGKEAVKREKWKIYLEEFGISAITSLFICVLTYRLHPWEHSVVAFLLFFLLFLFSGKGLINILYRFKNDMGILIGRLKEARQVQKAKTDLLARQESINMKIAGLDEEMRKPQSAIKELEAEQAYKIHIFISEYDLAAESRKSLGTTQLKKLA